MIHLILERQVPHPPHLVLQSRARASQSRLFRTHTNPKVAFLIASAVQSKPQEVDRLWAFTATFASVSMREATKFNELGLLFPVLSCCLTHPLERAERVLPALSPGHVTLGRVPLGQPPSLHCLRYRFLGFVRQLPRYLGAVRLPTSVHHQRSAFAFST